VRRGPERSNNENPEVNMEIYYWSALALLAAIILALLKVVITFPSKERKFEDDSERKILSLQQEHANTTSEMINAHADEIADLQSTQRKAMTDLNQAITHLKQKNRELSKQINQLQSQQGSPPREKNEGNAWMSNSTRSFK
jgi:peptidoglycan hydrolase CwlO-like protein